MGGKILGSFPCGGIDRWRLDQHPLDRFRSFHTQIPNLLFLNHTLRFLRNHFENERRNRLTSQC
jgi:hypothetical protein